MYCQNCGLPNPPSAKFCSSCGISLDSRSEFTENIIPSGASKVQYAGFWIRFLAFLIDTMIFFVIYTPVFYWNGARTISLIFAILPSWLYFWLFTAFTGQTPGKMLFNIRVKDGQGNKPGLGTVAKREILGKTLSIMVFYLGYLWIALDRQKQGLHDKIASTYVMKNK